MCIDGCFSLEEPEFSCVGGMFLMCEVWGMTHTPDSVLQEI